MKSPDISFGMAAVAVAMKARSGMLREVDRTDLAMAALRFMPHDTAVCAAVGLFVVRSRRDPVDAGAALQAFVSDRAEAMAPAPPPVVHPWQERADLQ